VYKRQSLYLSGQQIAISMLRTDYEVNVRESKIAKLNAQNEVAATRLSAQRKLLVVGSIGLLAVISLLFILYNLYQKSKAQNTIISKRDEEKSILLKEIHHRVKNNLQVISSLLKLQAKHIDDDKAVTAIAEGRSRVQSMALLHKNLYQDDNLKGVNMVEYFESLIQGLFDAYNIEEDRIRLETDVDELLLDVDTVIPLGLITNELISNALKHAFTDGNKGKIFVSLKLINDQLVLRVKDDGVGKVPKKADGKNGSFGTMLINSLSLKLNAEVSEITDAGTEVKVVVNDFKQAS